MVESDDESGRQVEGSERELRKHAQKSEPSSSARRAMGFLFGEAEVATVNEKNYFEVELEDEESRKEETPGISTVSCGAAYWGGGWQRYHEKSVMGWAGLMYYGSRSASADPARYEDRRACGTLLHIGETNEGGVTVKRISEEESEDKGAGGINGKGKVSSARSARSGDKGRTNLVHEGCALGSEVRHIGEGHDEKEKGGEGRTYLPNVPALVL
ncbi:hypothetical protein B0H14DRAFT_2587668 [Mycena olivaceomarginata]|nr:hypothetical protein B0H14DRAFT_2587668 [Mycena olivaceomarginata]